MIEKTFDLRIVDVDGELFFNIGELFFDRLEAYELFEGGKLVIKRNNEVIDETTDIANWGTHCSCTCFIGLKTSTAVNAVSADKFQVNDVLSLFFSCEEDFDFCSFLKNWYLDRKALINAFRKKPKTTVGELQKDFSKELVAVVSDEAEMASNILRFNQT